MCETILEYEAVDDAAMKQMVQEIEELLQNQGEKAKEQANEEKELSESIKAMGNGIIGPAGQGEKGMICGGLGTIQDEYYDSNQDSDFSGDEDE